MVTDEIDDRPEDTNITRGVAVIVMVDMQDIMNYKKGTR